jgi:type II secretion system protein C
MFVFMDISSIFREKFLSRRGGMILTEKSLKYIKITLIVLIAIVLLLMVRDTISLLFGDSDKSSPESSASASGSRQPRKAALVAFKPVVEDNVFGIKGAKFKPLSGARGTTKTTPTASQLEHLKLLGSVAWSGGFGYAFIAGPTGEQDVYKTGEFIEGAGNLVRVNAKSVIINASGSEVELPLLEVGEDSGGASSPPPRVINPRSQNKRVASDFARQTSENSFVVDQKAVEESIDNPENIMTDARLIPNMAGGKQDGFIIREVKNPGIYHSLGLQNNDILKSVNEFKLSNPQAALQAFSALKGMDYIELNIVRDGSPMTLTYSLR